MHQIGRTLDLLAVLRSRWLVAGVTTLLGLAVPAAGGQSADKCRVCHLEIFKEWRESWHSRSTQNREFTVAFQRWENDGNPGQVCMSCHAPKPIYQTPPPKKTDERAPHRPRTQADKQTNRHKAWEEKSELTEISEERSKTVRAKERALDARKDLVEALTRQPEPRADNLGEGVTCVSCHETKDDRKDQVMVGPYAVSAPHDTFKDPSLKTTRACVACHGQLHQPCQKQIQDWELSTLKTKVICQSCHMPIKDAKLVQWINFDSLPVRKVANHLFPGAHDPNTVQSAIRIEVEVVEGMVVVGLANRGAGHRVPGSPWRKLIALVQVFDAQGREVLRKRDGFFQERGNAIPPLGREIITFAKRANHAQVKVTLFYRFYPNQPDAEADRVAVRTFAL
jgi:hypothetical protein